MPHIVRGVGAGYHNGNKRMSERQEKKGGEEYVSPTIGDSLPQEVREALQGASSNSVKQVAKKPSFFGGNKDKQQKETAEAQTQEGGQSPTEQGTQRKEAPPTFEDIHPDLRNHLRDASIVEIFRGGRFLELDRATFDKFTALPARSGDKEGVHAQTTASMARVFGVVEKVRALGDGANLKDLETARKELIKLLAGMKMPEGNQKDVYQGLRTALEKVSEEVAEKIDVAERVKGDASSEPQPQAAPTTPEEVLESPATPQGGAGEGGSGEHPTPSPDSGTTVEEGAPLPTNSDPSPTQGENPLDSFTSGAFLYFSDDLFEVWMRNLPPEGEEAKIARNLRKLDASLYSDGHTHESALVLTCDICDVRKEIERLLESRQQSCNGSALWNIVRNLLEPDAADLAGRLEDEEAARLLRNTSPDPQGGGGGGKELMGADPDVLNARNKARTDQTDPNASVEAGKGRVKDDETVDRVKGIKASKDEGEGSLVTWSLWERAGYNELRAARDEYLAALADYEKRRAESSRLGKFLGLESFELHAQTEKRDKALVHYNTLLSKVRGDFKERVNKHDGELKKFEAENSLVGKKKLVWDPEKVVTEKGTTTKGAWVATDKEWTKEALLQQRAQRVERLSKLHDLMLRQSMMRDVAAIEQAARDAKVPGIEAWQWCKEKYQKYYGSLPNNQKLAIAMSTGFLLGFGGSFVAAGLGVAGAVGIGGTAAVRRGIGFGAGLMVGAGTKEGLTAAHRTLTEGARAKKDAKEESLAALRDMRLARHRRDKHVGMVSTGAAGFVAWLAGGGANGALAGVLEGNLESVGGHITDNWTAKSFRTLFFGGVGQAQGAVEPTAPPPPGGPPTPPAAPPTPPNIPPNPPPTESLTQPSGAPGGGDAAAAFAVTIPEQTRGAPPAIRITEGPTQPGNFTARDAVDIGERRAEHSQLDRRAIEHTPEERARMKREAAGAAAPGQAPVNPHGASYTTQTELRPSFEQGLGTKLSVTAEGEASPGGTQGVPTAEQYAQEAMKRNAAMKGAGQTVPHTAPAAQGHVTQHDSGDSLAGAVQSMRSGPMPERPTSLTLSGHYAPGESVERVLQHFLADDAWVKKQYPDLTAAERGRVAHLLQAELAKNPKLAGQFAKAFGVQKGNWNLVGRGSGYEVQLDTGMVERLLDRVRGQRSGVVEHHAPRPTAVEAAAKPVPPEPAAQRPTSASPTQQTGGARAHVSNTPEVPDVHPESVGIATPELDARLNAPKAVGVTPVSEVGRSLDPRARAVQAPTHVPPTPEQVRPAGGVGQSPEAAADDTMSPNRTYVYDRRTALAPTSEVAPYRRPPVVDTVGGALVGTRGGGVQGGFMGGVRVEDVRGPEGRVIFLHTSPDARVSNLAASSVRQLFTDSLRGVPKDMPFDQAVQRPEYHAVLESLRRSFVEAHNSYHPRDAVPMDTPLDQAQFRGFTARGVLEQLFEQIRRTQDAATAQRSRP